MRNCFPIQMHEEKLHVIASEAKQSVFSQREKQIASVVSLLRNNPLFNVFVVCFIFLTTAFVFVGAGRNKNPTVLDVGKGRIVVLPGDVADYLRREFPGCKIPMDSEFDPPMLKYYYSRLIGIHPAVAWGDFNDDKKRDYAFLLGTGQTPWGPIVELVVLNGGKKSGEYEPFRLGELNGFKNDYISFADNKLYKGEYKKGGWYINWDKKEKKYVTFKS